MADETAENQETDEAAKAAAADAEKALEAIETEAAAELPADDAEAAVPTKAATQSSTKAAAQPDDTGRANRRKVREGIVVSDAMTATVVVAVVDRVRVMETRPMSKLKRWRVTEVLERAK